MLKHLTIKNYALIKSAEIDFNAGFSVITGETGAGKSILLGALNLLLGQRVDTDAINDKSQKCVIEGIFKIDNFKLNEIFNQLDVDYDENTIIRREILPSGKSRAFINDTPVALNRLKLLTSQLVDVHGQHQTYELFDAEKQLEIVTVFAKAHNELTAYQDALKVYRELQKEFDRTQADLNKTLTEKDYLEFSLNELEQADLQNTLSPDEMQTQINRLENAEEIKRVLYFLASLFTENELAIEGQLSDALQQLSAIKNYDDKLETLFNRIESLKIELTDISAEAVNQAEAIEDNPQLLMELLDKQRLIDKLMFKHQCTSIEALRQKEAEIAERLLSLNTSSQKLENLHKQILLQEKKLTDLAQQLSHKRKTAAHKLAKKIAAILTIIGIPDAQVEIQFEQLPQFNDNGVDAVTFNFSANKGKKPQPLKKIASGGELSRFMLAVKKIESEQKHLPTLIFDEIDSGVSGEISDKMGEMLAQMAAQAQVIAITHSPQIAAKANNHWFVYKETKNKNTVSNIKLLSEKERIDEIAKMLSGNKITQTAIEHAKNLLVH